MDGDKSRRRRPEAENAGLRDLFGPGRDRRGAAAAQAGIDATESEAARRLQRLLLEELHHRVKNTLSTVIAITSQSRARPRV